MDVHDLLVVSSSGVNEYDRSRCPDYGQAWQSARGVVLPEYCSMGGLDVSGLKGGEGDGQYTSYNGKSVADASGNAVPVRRTNYELILGQTSFSFDLDLDSFGHVYLKTAVYDEEEGAYVYTRFDSLKEYLEEGRGGSTANDTEFTQFTNSGEMGGVKIENKVSVRYDISGAALVSSDPFIIRNVYDGFKVSFGDFRSTADDNIFYSGVSGTFSYDSKNPHVASCVLDGRTYTFQAIVDGVSSPML